MGLFLSASSYPTESVNATAMEFHPQWWAGVPCKVAELQSSKQQHANAILPHGHPSPRVRLPTSKNHKERVRNHTHNPTYSFSFPQAKLVSGRQTDSTPHPPRTFSGFAACSQFPLRAQEPRFASGLDSPVAKRRKLSPVPATLPTTVTTSHGNSISSIIRQVRQLWLKPEPVPVPQIRRLPPPDRYYDLGEEDVFALSPEGRVAALRGRDGQSLGDRWVREEGYSRVVTLDWSDEDRLFDACMASYAYVERLRKNDGYNSECSDDESGDDLMIDLLKTASPELDSC